MCIRDRCKTGDKIGSEKFSSLIKAVLIYNKVNNIFYIIGLCLLYTSDAADDLLCVDLGGRRIIKTKKYISLNEHYY